MVDEGRGRQPPLATVQQADNTVAQGNLHWLRSAGFGTSLVPVSENTHNLQQFAGLPNPCKENYGFDSRPGYQPHPGVVDSTKLRGNIDRAFGD